MRRMFFTPLLRQCKRRAWVANPADPTQVTQYRWGQLTLIASWGIEARWRSRRLAYDHPFVNWLFGGLEETYNLQQAAFDEDPMGRLSDYV